jgi:hypothetical protein
VINHPSTNHIEFKLKPITSLPTWVPLSCSNSLALIEILSLHRIHRRWPNEDNNTYKDSLFCFSRLEKEHVEEPVAITPNVTHSLIARHDLDGVQASLSP